MVIDNFFHHLVAKVCHDIILTFFEQKIAAKKCSEIWDFRSLQLTTRHLERGQALFIEKKEIS